MRSIVGATVIFGVGTYVWKKANLLWSSSVYASMNKPEVSPCVARGQFTDCAMVLNDPVQHHTHAQSAADRSSATNFAVRYAAGMGLTPYFIQCSHSDQRAGHAGSRVYYWPKDLTTIPADFCPPERSLLVLIDVDFYVDMRALLLSTGYPVLLYTLQPEAVAATEKEYSFTFDANNVVHYHVSGGAYYTHMLWDYAGDSTLVADLTWWKILLPWNINAAAYLLDRRGVAKHHALVLFTPIGHWKGISALLMICLAKVGGANTLRRLQVAVGKYLRLNVITPDGHFRSTGYVNSYHCATVRVDVDDHFAALSRTGKVDLSLPQCLRDTAENRAAAVALVEFHREHVGSKANTVYTTEQGVRRYQYSPASFEPEAKPAVVAYMSPLIDECYAPDRCRSNDERAVKARIVDVASSVEMTPFISRVMYEFIERFMPKPQALSPVELEEVYARQNRPSQRRILDDACQAGTPQRMVKMFTKAESYAEPKDPRPISTINGQDKMEYSQFIYAISEYLATQPWYAFCKTPLEISTRVTKVLEHARMATNTDLSRFDGRVSSMLRELERLILVRAFPMLYLETLLELHRSQFNLKAVSSYGVKYETGYARASGSPETAAFNSIANAFMAFLALRMTRVNGSFIQADAAYAHLGIYGGDDGLTADVDPTSYEKAAKSVGQVLQCEPVSRGAFGIKFLSRVYGPDVWFGDPSSCCDLPRQLAKIHVTVRLPPNISPADKLVQKCMAFYLTDKNTPIIGPLVRRVIDVAAVSAGAVPEILMIVPWFARYATEVQFPNEDSGWMQDYAQQALGGFDFGRFDQWLSTATDLTKLLAPPLCLEPKPIPDVKAPVVVNEEVINPKPPVAKATHDHKSGGKRRHAEGSPLRSRVYSPKK